MNSFHEFSIVDGERKLLVLSAEDNKARFWMSAIAKEIERARNVNIPSNIVQQAVVPGNGKDVVSISSLLSSNRGAKHFSSRIQSS